MKRCGAFCLAALGVFMALSEAALAHRVNVFAYVDGDAIQVECGFSRSQRVKNGRLVVSDGETGETILEGVTDDQGRFRFRPPDAFLESGHGLNIRLFAGEGHLADWKLSAEALKALSTALSILPSERPGTPADAGGQLVQPLRERAVVTGIDAAELEAIIGRVVDAKLAPVREALARREEGQPGFREIIGGIGWIVGLLGMATYMHSRTRRPD